MAYGHQMRLFTEMQVGLNQTLAKLRELKSEALTSDHARNVAVTITEFEKVKAYYDVFVYGGAFQVQQTTEQTPDPYPHSEGWPGTAKPTIPNG